MSIYRLPMNRSRRGFETGFSLVELMVSLALGLLIVSGLSVLFFNSSQVSTELDKSVRQIESGRYAMDVLSDDIRLAGFYYEIPALTYTAVTVDACASTVTDSGWDFTALKIPAAIVGASSTQASSLSCLPNAKSGTVALAVHRFETSTTTVAATDLASIYVQTSRCDKDPATSLITVDTSATPFTLRDQDCITVKPVHRYVTRIYYVASCNECGVDTTPTLKRVEISGTKKTTSPLAEGVEEIAFEYGFDTNNNGEPDVYLLGLSGTAGAADNDWSNVVAVRTYLLTRTTEATAGFSDPKTYNLGMSGSRGPYTDNYKRRIYSSTIRLNNVAGPRESS